MGQLAEFGSLKKEFLVSVRRASEELGVSPVRPIPEKLILEDFPIQRGYRAGALWRGKTLVLSSNLDSKRLLAALKREAFSLLIPADLDKIQVIYDLAWAYSGADLGWWKECTRVIWDPRFPLYDAPEVLSSLPRKKLIEVMRRILHLVRLLWGAGRKINLELYLSIFNEAAGLLEPVRLSKVQTGVVEELAKNPYLSQRELAARLGFSRSAISKALSKLTSLGILSGPENVVLERIGLAGILTIIVDREGMEESLAEFPFTYRILRPISRRSPSLGVLMFPSEGLPRLRSVLAPWRVKLSRILAFTLTFKRSSFEPAKDTGNALKKLKEVTRFGILGEREFEVPRLTKNDLEIVNYVLKKGRVSVSDVRRMGIPSAESRLRRLRELGIIRKFYSIGGFRLGRPVSLMINCDQNDFPRVSAALGALSTSVAFWVEGDFKGVWAVLLTSVEDISKLTQATKLVFGENLVDIVPLADFSPSYWTLPVDLWDEKNNRFRYEVALEELASHISPHHPGDAGGPPGDQRPDEVD